MGFAGNSSPKIIAEHLGGVGSFGGLPPEGAGEVNFLVSKSGFVSPVPAGAAGPASTRGSGIMFTGGAGGHGFADEVSSVLVLDANSNQGARTYYLNSSGQKVDYETGRTISNSHPRAHIYHDESQ
jgi:hypothetical protein